MKKELSIKTVSVEIRVLKVDGKRMTKAVFDQITICKTGPIKVIGGKGKLDIVKDAEPLGWVKGRIGNNWLVFERGNALYKTYYKDAILLGTHNVPHEIPIEKIAKDYFAELRKLVKSAHSDFDSVVMDIITGKAYFYPHSTEDQINWACKLAETYAAIKENYSHIEPQIKEANEKLFNMFHAPENQIFIAA